MKYERPDFLGPGVFEWDALGYRFSDQPPINLMDPMALRHDNPWIVLAAVLVRAKVGQFDSVHLLIDCPGKSKELSLWRACFDLLGDAGSSRIQNLLLTRFRRELFETPDLAYQLHIPKSLHQSMLLWTVPQILEIYVKSTVRKETGILTVYLSRLLEPGFGPIACATAADDEYRHIVMNEYKRLREEFGTDQCPVLFGQKFSVRRLAQRLHGYLVADQIKTVTILRQRHFFEAATGIDCSGFCKNEELDPLAAVAIVEEFLEGPEATKYEEGARYFFGHRIPD